MSNKQEAKAGEHSTIIQVTGDYIQGLQEEDVRKITHEVIRQELTILTEEARKTFLERIDNISDELIDSISKINPSLFERFNDPAIQIALHSICCEYGKTGDENLKESLIDLMLDRIRAVERNQEQLIINEALTLLPKLSDTHINFLVLFLFSSFHIKLPLDLMKKVIDRIECLLKSASQLNYSDVSYLLSIGCLHSVPFMKRTIPIDENLTTSYNLLNQKGIEPETFVAETKLFTKKDIEQIFEYDALLDKYLFKETNFNNLSGIISSKTENSQEIRILFSKYLTSEDDVKKYYSSKNLYWDSLFQMWHSCSISQHQISDAAQKIAHHAFFRILKQDEAST